MILFDWFSDGLSAGVMSGVVVHLIAKHSTVT